MEKMAIDAIIVMVADHFNITVNQLISDLTSPKYSTPRKVVAYILHKEHGLQAEKTGKVLNRDHSTVTIACKTLLEACDVDSKLKQQLEDCLVKSREIVRTKTKLSKLTIKIHPKKLFNGIYSELESLQISTLERVELTTNIIATLTQHERE